MTQSKMKRVTKNNLLVYISWKKKYIESGKTNKELLNSINNFTVNVINKDTRYFSKILEYGFSKKDLDLLLY